MLAKINWTFFFKEELFVENMPALLAAMGKEIKEKTEDNTNMSGPPNDSKNQCFIVLYGMTVKFDLV